MGRYIIQITKSTIVFLGIMGILASPGLADDTDSSQEANVTEGESSLSSGWNGEFRVGVQSSYLDDFGREPYSDYVTESQLRIAQDQGLFAEMAIQTGGMDLGGSDNLGEKFNAAVGWTTSLKSFDLLAGVNFLKRAPRGSQGDLWGPWLRVETPVKGVMPFLDLRWYEPTNNTSWSNQGGALVSAGARWDDDVAMGSRHISAAVTHDDGVFVDSGPEGDSNGTFVDLNMNVNIAFDWGDEYGAWSINPNARGIVALDSNKDSKFAGGVDLVASF